MPASCASFCTASRHPSHDCVRAADTRHLAMSSDLLDMSLAFKPVSEERSRSATAFSSALAQEPSPNNCNIVNAVFGEDIAGTPVRCPLISMSAAYSEAEALEAECNQDPHIVSPTIPLPQCLPGDVRVQAPARVPLLDTQDIEPVPVVMPLPCLVRAARSDRTPLATAAQRGSSVGNPVPVSPLSAISESTSTSSRTYWTPRSASPTRPDAAHCNAAAPSPTTLRSSTPNPTHPPQDDDSGELADNEGNGWGERGDDTLAADTPMSAVSPAESLPCSTAAPLPLGSPPAAPDDSPTTASARPTNPCVPVNTSSRVEGVSDSACASTLASTTLLCPPPAADIFHGNLQPVLSCGSDISIDAMLYQESLDGEASACNLTTNSPALRDDSGTGTPPAAMFPAISWLQPGDDDGYDDSATDVYDTQRTESEVHLNNDWESMARPGLRFRMDGDLGLICCVRALYGATAHARRIVGEAMRDALLERSVLGNEDVLHDSEPLEEKGMPLHGGSVAGLGAAENGAPVVQTSTLTAPGQC
jgi:hypothetical protein